MKGPCVRPLSLTSLMNWELGEEMRNLVRWHFGKKCIIEKTTKIYILKFINLEISIFKKTLMSASLGPHQKASCNRWQLAQQPQGVKVQRAAGNRGKLSPRWAAYITPLLLRIQDHGVCVWGGGDCKLQQGNGVFWKQQGSCT